MRPDVHELMHGCKSAQDRPVTNGNVTGQGGGIAENHTVAQDAVVSDMCVGHDQAIHAHFRISKRLCSAIDGGTFAYGGTIANDHLAVFPRSEEHTSELQSLMRISYAVFCLNKKIENCLEKTANHSLITQKG